jgi:hypothetical protein
MVKALRISGDFVADSSAKTTAIQCDFVHNTLRPLDEMVQAQPFPAQTIQPQGELQRNSPENAEHRSF